MPVSFVFAFAGIKTGWDKRKEQKMPVSLCLHLLEDRLG